MAPVVKVQEIVRMDSSNISNNPAANAALSTETEPYGKIVVIKRSGQDSASFELIENGYIFGRAVDCDIRIQLLSISENHCKISRNDHGQVTPSRVFFIYLFIFRLGDCHEFKRKRNTCKWPKDERRFGRTWS